jgi:hypothetical protein
MTTSTYRANSRHLLWVVKMNIFKSVFFLPIKLIGFYLGGGAGQSDRLRKGGLIVYMIDIFYITNN